jgi:hypothetical protein
MSCWSSKWTFQQNFPSWKRWLNVPGLPAVAVGGAPLTVRRFSNSCGISRAAAFALKPEPGHVVALYPTSFPQHLDDGTRAIPKYTRTYIKGLSLSTRGKKGQCRVTSGSDSHWQRSFLQPSSTCFQNDPMKGRARAREWGATTAELQQMQRFIRPFWLSHAMRTSSSSIIDGLNLDEPEDEAICWREG